MDIRQVLAELRSDREFMRRVAAWERLPARPAATAPFPAMLDRRLVAALQVRGIESLYTHQAHAIEAIAHGEHIAVVTSTASGKMASCLTSSSFCANSKGLAMVAEQQMNWGRLP